MLKDITNELFAKATQTQTVAQPTTDNPSKPPSNNPHPPQKPPSNPHPLQALQTLDFNHPQGHPKSKTPTPGCYPDSRGNLRDSALEGVADKENCKNGRNGRNRGRSEAQAQNSNHFKALKATNPDQRPQAPKTALKTRARSLSFRKKIPQIAVGKGQFPGWEGRVAKKPGKQAKATKKEAIPAASPPEI